MQSLLQAGPFHLLWAVFWFLVVLTVLVFVHELGHYLLARYNRVRVEVFSIGFGPELFGWHDRAGTRWKFSAIPLGGYVKMFGDSDATSALPTGRVAEMTPAEREVSFHYKRLGQRAAIVAGGPASNFVFAIVVLALLFMTYGEPFTPPTVSQLVQGGAAERAGIQVGDVITSIDGQPIERFEDVQRLVRLNPGTPITIVVRRSDQLVTLHATPIVNSHNVAQLGIGHTGAPDYIKRGPLSAIGRSVVETWNMVASTFEALWQIVIGARNSDEIGGPLRIAQISGQVAQFGIGPLLSFMAVLSINLGLINLFPVPVLDGGHLLFYAAEAIRGKPLGQRAQEYGFRIGLALVLTLMVFATWNDLVHVGIVEFVKRLVT
jgi:regulator of sigma E protease